MNPHTWFEKADRLRSTLALLRQTRSGENELMAEDRDATERVAIAHWLREEFSDEPPEDTATLALYFGAER